jgi:hypothetical protein
VVSPMVGVSWEGDTCSDGASKNPAWHCVNAQRAGEDMGYQLQRWQARAEGCFSGCPTKSVGQPISTHRL